MFPEVLFPRLWFRAVDCWSAVSFFILS